MGRCFKRHEDPRSVRGFFLAFVWLLLLVACQYALEFGKRRLYGFPDDVQVRFEVAVGHAITHAAQFLPGIAGLSRA